MRSAAHLNMSIDFFVYVYVFRNIFQSSETLSEEVFRENLKPFVIHLAGLQAILTRAAYQLQVSMI